MFICCRRDDEGKYFWGSGSCISDSGLVPLRTQEGGTMNDQGRSSTDIKRGRPGCHTGRYCTGCMAATHGHDGEARRASRVDSGPSTMTRLGGNGGGEEVFGEVVGYLSHPARTNLVVTEAMMGESAGLDRAQQTGSGQGSTAVGS